MNVEQVIVNPESLQEASQQFKRRAAMHQQNLSTIIGELNSLRSQGPEGWIGDAANQHFAEMDQHVLPGYKRLIEALHEAVATMKFTQNEFHTADQEGSKAFKQLDSTGNAEADAAIQKGGSGAPGAVDTGGQANGGSGNGATGSGGLSGSGNGSAGTGGGLASDGGQSGGGQSGGGQSGGSGQPSGGQQGAGSAGAQKGGSSGSLGAGSGSNNSSTSGVRSGSAVGQAGGDSNGWMAGLAAVGGTVIAGAKMANDMRKK